LKIIEIYKKFKDSVIQINDYYINLKFKLYLAIANL